MSEKILSREKFYSRDNLVIYKEFPEDIRRNFDYEVTVTQGNQTHSIPVYNHTMEYNLLGRMVGGDLYRRFATFAFSGSQVRVDIKVGFDFDTYSVFPSAKKFKSTYSDGVISVYLDKPDYFGIILDDYTNSILSVIADLPEYPADIPDKDGEGVIFVDSWKDTEDGILHITEPNTTLYIAPGAVLNARVDIEAQAVGTKVIGRGAILDPYEDIYHYDINYAGSEGRGYKMCTIRANDCIYDGPFCMDARCFNIMTTGNNISVRNYKVFCSMMTSDGFTTGGKDNTFEHCWIYNGDNGIVMSGGDNHTYRDITIGTTCKALFPQIHTTNMFLENIYVFRVGEPAITNVYNNTTPRNVSITINNFDLIDCTNLPAFFQAQNMGTLPKVINFNNVSLPTMSGKADPHREKPNGTINNLIIMKNPENLFTENYTLNFKNLYIDGKAVESFDDVVVNRDYNNTYNISNDGTYTPVARDLHTANYKSCGRVYAGALRLAFKDEVIIRDGEFYLPAKQTIKYLRATNEVKTTQINGADYVKSSDLAQLDTVEGVEIKGGDLYITVAQKQGNLLTADEGRISRISETNCYLVDLVVEHENDETIYACYAHRDACRGGISIMTTPEVKIYGAGEYEFSFDVRCDDEEDSVIRFGWCHDNNDNSFTTSIDETISRDWVRHTAALTVTEDMLSHAQFLVRIVGTTMKKYSLKNIEITKK